MLISPLLREIETVSLRLVASQSNQENTVLKFKQRPNSKDRQTVIEENIQYHFQLPSMAINIFICTHRCTYTHRITGTHTHIDAYIQTQVGKWFF